MPNLIKLGQGLYDNYAGLASKDQYQVYFTTDTHQVFVGADEYTKSTLTLSGTPDASTPGDKGRLYAYNGNLYLCGGGTAGAYVWTRVANVNDTAGTITSVEVGEGLTTASGSTSITSTDEIKHAVPSGAAVVADPTADATPGFGSTFAIQGVATDKFGHVTASTTRTVTLPTETAVSVTDETGTATTLDNGGSFSVVTAVAKGTGSHEIEETTTTFTLPTSYDTTYSISSTEEGIVTLTPSSGDATTALINGWGDLAKKSDITAVFKYKGTVASVEDLPKAADVGDVYKVDTAEYVCITAGTGAADPATWEELGPVVDLSAYATTAYVNTAIETALTWATF